jgi:hypothetical protein
MSFMDFLNPLSNKKSIFYPSLDPLHLMGGGGDKNALAQLGTPSYGPPTRWDAEGNGYADPTYGGQAQGYPTPQMPAQTLWQQPLAQMGQSASPQAAYYQPQPQPQQSLSQSSFGGGQSGFDQWSPQSWDQRRINPLVRR